MNLARLPIRAHLAAGALASGLLACGGALAQPADYAAPRTAFDQPDLQGVWTNASLTTLERPAGVDKLVLNEEEAAALVAAGGWNAFIEADQAPTDQSTGAPPAGQDVGGYNTFWMDPGSTLARVNGEIRSSWIVEPEDGRIPYSGAGQVRMATMAANRLGFDGPENRLLGERCLVGFGSTGGPPMLNVLYNNHYQIVQTPDHVVILVEMNHDARIIPLNAEHRPDAMHQWLGDSIGWWEGDTLVIETVNMHPDQGFRAGLRHRLFIPQDATVTERLTRVSDDDIFYEWTVDAPSSYTQPWRGEMVLRADDQKIYEYACHEGNYALPGILRGAREEERRAAAAPDGASGE